MRQLLALALISCGLGAAYAQPVGLKRSVLARIDTSASAQEAVMVSVELATGASTGLHSHHGLEIGHILEGQVEMRIDGEASRELKAGDSFAIPAGKTHDASNSGSTPARVIVTYVVEKDKPLALPAK